VERHRISQFVFCLQTIIDSAVAMVTTMRALFGAFAMRIALNKNVCGADPFRVAMNFG
jgi:hypothetical protein